MSFDIKYCGWQLRGAIVGTNIAFVRAVLLKTAGPKFVVRSSLCRLLPLWLSCASVEIKECLLHVSFNVHMYKHFDVSCHMSPVLYNKSLLLTRTHRYTSTLLFRVNGKGTLAFVAIISAPECIVRPFASTPAARTKDTVIWSFNGQICSCYNLNWINVRRSQINRMLFFIHNVFLHLEIR
jgi:hypothetical protein